MSAPKPSPESQSPSARLRVTWSRPWFVALILAAMGAGFWWYAGDVGHAQRGPQGAFGKQPPQPVTAAVARAQALPVWLSALGTVTPRSLVNVMPRVSGLLQSVDYHQGQMVKQGQLLAQIDPRPFRIAVEQAQAQVDQTKAQLAGAQRDLARYETLLKQDSIAEQQVSDQRATVAQYNATLEANEAALNNAQLQLAWTRITAPISGLVGLRPVDAGNMVTTGGAVGASATSTAGSATPIATIAQVQPIDVTFALPQQHVADVVGQLMQGKRLEAQAWDARNTKLLASGMLLAADNQINAATGTLNMRAAFGNRDMTLYPNQFVNVRLLVRTIPDAVVVPTTAVGVGAPGSYVYVIGAEDKVSLRNVTTGETYGELTQIRSGLKPGERVVTDGLDRLRDGRQVKVVPQHGEAPISGASRPPGAQRPPGHARSPATTRRAQGARGA